MKSRILGIGLVFVAVFAQAADDKQGGFARFLTDKEWAVAEVGDPTGLVPDSIVQRFELRPGDCLSEPPFNDCEKSVERAELAQDMSPPSSSTQAFWYRWQVFFPEDFEGSYPARNRHGQFIDEATGEAAWVFELGSTGTLWFGSRFDDESRFYSLISERELRGQWQDIIVEGVWSNPHGRINVWVNDEQRVRYRGPTCERCRIFLSYGISRVGVDEFKKRYPEKELPAQVVYYLPARSQAEDPGWIVAPSPEPKDEVEGDLERTPKNEVETLDAEETDVAEGSTPAPETEIPDEDQEDTDGTVDSSVEDTKEGVTIVSEPEADTNETTKAESQDTDIAPESSGQILDPETTDESNPDADTETESMSSEDGAFDGQVKPDPVADDDDRR
ncbi:MAG: hypothetical protein HOM12_09215 [Proteobacteria bacterium]|nr:hypothetical protein [Pseudomonadota bacterium]MBT5818922.1 hypothetical protein [Pseudomonadota bacterium]